MWFFFLFYPAGCLIEIVDRDEKSKEKKKTIHGGFADFHSELKNEGFF